MHQVSREKVNKEALKSLASMTGVLTGLPPPLHGLHPNWGATFSSQCQWLQWGNVWMSSIRDQPSEWTKILDISHKLLLGLALVSAVIGVALVSIEIYEFNPVENSHSWARPYAGIGVVLIGQGLVAGVLGAFVTIGRRTRRSRSTRLPRSTEGALTPDS